MKKETVLSKAAYRIQGQPMFKVLDRVRKLESRGERVIHFEIGDPDFDTPAHIIEAAYRSMKNKETHYTSSMGLYDMRLAAAEVTGFSRKFTPSVEQVLITPGANIIIYLAVKCLVNPGEEIICPDPGFPTYYSVAKLCNVVAKHVPLRESNRFRMSPADIRKAITKKTRLIIINSPNNPTGSVMTGPELDEIYDIASSRKIFLYCDEIYSRMIYGQTKFYSPSVRDKCRKFTIVANGFSKAFAMTGWRLGVAIAPKKVIEKMGLLVQTICSCVPPFIQRAGIAALKEDQSEIRQMMQVYKERRDVLVDGLNGIKGISCLKAEGAFYVFPNITQTGLSAEKFSELMLKQARVALLPGTNFGNYGKGYVRLTYATSLENIKEGLKRISRALKT